MVLGKLSVPERATNLGKSRARAYCAYGECGWGLFGHFSLGCHISFLSPSLLETARYRLKYCLKGPLYCIPVKINTVFQFCHRVYVYIQNQPTCTKNWKRKRFHFLFVRFIQTLAELRLPSIERLLEGDMNDKLRFQISFMSRLISGDNALRFHFWGCKKQNRSKMHISAWTCNCFTASAIRGVFKYYCN